jgi:pyruvate dehydrogenase E2 component (dihydrolipoamide acetyltransferase)
VTEAPPEPTDTHISRLASPPVRHLAHQLGVDIATVAGSGRGGRITRQDVQAAAAAIAQPPPRRRITPRARRLAQQRGVDIATLGTALVTGDDVPPSAAEPVSLPSPRPTQTRVGPPDRRDSMRLATARLMARSAREIPHYYVTSTIDVAPMTAWLAAHNAALPVRQRVLPIAVLLRAVCKAAIAVPDLNGHWIDEAFVPGDGIHLGVATATRGGGLVTPALRDAGALDVDALMAALTDLIRRARKGSLRSSEIAPGTLTVSSLADGGPDALFGVIYPPQVALVGVGGITERAWAVNGMLTVRPTVTITLAADHRATAGRTGAAFLAAIAESLAHPEEL